jgi:hypothetical protein
MQSVTHKVISKIIDPKAQNILVYYKIFHTNKIISATKVAIESLAYGHQNIWT